MANIYGVLDGALNGDAIGWVFSTDSTDRTPRVRFVGEAGRAIEFGATIWRADVCAAMQCSGAFGFAVPLAALSDLGSRIEVQAENGSALINGCLTIAEAPSVAEPAQKKPALIFLHIQKTAGTSVRTIFEKILGPSAKVYLYGDPPGINLRQFVRLPLHQRKQLRLVMGHTFFGIHRYIGQQAKYATILRDPFQRINSQYWHHRALGVRTGLAGGARLPLHVIVNEGLTEEFDNLQVRATAGIADSEVNLGQIESDDAKLALENIREHFIFACKLDNIYKEYPRMLEYFGGQSQDLPISNESKFTGTYDDEDYMKIDWKKVMDRHQPDQELYISSP